MSDRAGRLFGSSKRKVGGPSVDPGTGRTVSSRSAGVESILSAQTQGRVRRQNDMDYIMGVRSRVANWERQK
jgi:hypothetical protein